MISLRAATGTVPKVPRGELAAWVPTAGANSEKLQEIWFCGAYGICARLRAFHATWRFGKRRNSMRFWSLLALVVSVGLVHFPTTEAGAQKVPVLGYMANENVNPERLAIFKKGLVNLGYVEGKTIAFEYQA